MSGVACNYIIVVCRWDKQSDNTQSKYHRALSPTSWRIYPNKKSPKTSMDSAVRRGSFHIFLISLHFIIFFSDLLIIKFYQLFLLNSLRKRALYVPLCPPRFLLLCCRPFSLFVISLQLLCVRLMHSSGITAEDEGHIQV